MKTQTPLNEHNPAKALATLGILTLGVGLMIAVTLAGSHDAPTKQTRQELAKVRQATARYQNLGQACADGYVLAPPYFPQMGLHAWIWQGNPDGVFAPFNPTIPADGPVVDCP